MGYPVKVNDVWQTYDQYVKIYAINIRESINYLIGGNMEKIRYAIIGSGWRSLYYIRIAKALPGQFEVTAMLVRSEEKRLKMAEEYGIFATTSEEALLATKPDFVVSAISRADNWKLCIEYMKKGIPVLAETPAANTLEELLELWEAKEEYNGRLQVAEQYFLYPTYEARLRIAREGYLGHIQNATISALHDYHGISILRLFLQAGYSNAAITARKYTWPIAVTQNRSGELQKGDVSEQTRTRAEFVFDNDTVGFYDFCGVQYHTYVRSRHLNVQGVRGEIDDDKVYYLSDENIPMIETLTPANDGIRRGIESIAFAGKAFYRNPFPTNVLPEDETAIAGLLIGMKKYIATGEELYPLADAMQDAYLTSLLKEAVATGETVMSQSQVWACARP